MNKLIIGLLIVAAGTGVFFLLRNKKNEPAGNKINREFILGKWQTLSVEPGKDSVETDYRFEFQKEGLVLRSKSDSAAADSMYYQWNEKDQLVLKQNKDDSTATTFSVSKLTTDTLAVNSQEQHWVFSRVK